MNPKPLSNQPNENNKTNTPISDPNFNSTQIQHHLLNQEPLSDQHGWVLVTRKNKQRIRNSIQNLQSRYSIKAASTFQPKEMFLMHASWLYQERM
jgi:hypothetical protein